MPTLDFSISPGPVLLKRPQNQPPVGYCSRDPAPARLPVTGHEERLHSCGTDRTEPVVKPKLKKSSGRSAASQP